MAVQSELIISVKQRGTGTAVAGLEAVKRQSKALEKQSRVTARALENTKLQLEKMAGAARATAIATAAAMAGVTKLFADFETSATNVRNITDKTAAEMRSLTDAVMGLPPELGDATDLMNALYQTLSSGVPEQNAIEFLELHAKAAKGNLADLTETVDAGSSIMNAYSLDIAEMGNVLDAMTKTVDLGKVTFGDLASNIGKGISIAQSAGASYQELMAILATLTLNGLQVEEGMTAVRNIMLAALKPTEAMRANAEALGVDMSAAALKAKGFAQWMGDIAVSVQDNAELTASLFPNIRALNGAMKLASSEGGAKYNSILEQIMNSTGKVEDNFRRMSETLKAQSAAAGAELKKLGIEFGEILAQDLLPIVKGIREMATAFRELTPEQKEAVLGYTKLTLAMSGVILIAPKLIGAYKTIAAATVAMRAATGLSTLALGGWATAIVAAAAAGVALEMWLDSMNPLTREYKDGLEDAAAAQKAFAEAARDISGISASQLIQEFGSLEKALAAAAKPMHELHDVYMSLQEQTKDQLIAQEFERILKEIGRWEQLAEGWESIGNMIAFAKEEGNALNHVYKAAVKTIELQEQKQQALNKAIEDEKKLLQEIKKANEARAKAIVDSANKILKQGRDLIKRQREEKEALEERLEAERELQEELDRNTEQFLQNMDEMRQAAEWFPETIRGDWIQAIGAFNPKWESVLRNLQQKYKEAKAEIKPIEIAVTYVPDEAVKTGKIEKQFVKFSEALGDMTANTLASAFEAGIIDGTEGVRSVLQGFTQSMGDMFFDSVNQGLRDAFEAAAKVDPKTGKAGGFAAFTEQIDADFWKGAGGVLAGAFMRRAQQEGDKGKAALAGAVQGFLASGTIIGAIVGAIAGYFGTPKVETPQARARVGYTSRGTFAAAIETRNAEVLAAELERTWGQSQAAIFDSIKASYRGIIQMFRDPALLEGFALTDLPEFQMPFNEWFQGSAQDLATYLKETYWPEAFREYFRSAIEVGLTALGVTEQSIAHLNRELERLPGEQTIQALGDFVSALVGSTRLLEAMDFEQVWSEVIETPRDAMARLSGQITQQLEVLAAGWDGLTGVEQARQLNEMVGLVRQAREGEIQYLRSIYQVQETINQNIENQIENIRLASMSAAQQAVYARGQIEDIFTSLQAGGLDASEIAQLESDAERYISLLREMGGETLTFAQVQTDAISLMQSLDISAIMSDVTMTNRQAMELARAEINQQLTDLFTGLAGADPAQQIADFTQINNLIVDARESEIQYLRQIKSIQDGINASIAKQKEQILLETMSQPEQFQYAYRQVIDIISQLNAGGLSAQQVQQMTSDAQSYIRMLQTLIEGGFGGEQQFDLSALMGSLAQFLPQGVVAQYGQTDVAGFLNNLLDMLSQTANEALGEEQQAAIDQISNFSDIISNALEIVSGSASAFQDAMASFSDEYFIGLFQELQALANTALQEAISESEARLRGYNDMLLMATDRLRMFGDVLAEITGLDLTVPIGGGPGGITKPGGQGPDPTKPQAPQPGDDGKTLPGSTLGDRLLESMMVRDEMLMDRLERLGQTVDRLSGKVSEISAQPPVLMVQVDGSIAPLISLIQSVQLGIASDGDPGLGGMQ